MTSVPPPASPASLPAFHVMAKPTGARCNLRCDYCFFLAKDRLYPDSTFRMSEEVLEAYISQTITAHQVPEVTVAWQGGEPTLMGLDFFRKAVELEKKYAPAGMRIENTLQTNGVLLDEEWCDFLREQGFLVGLSLDGPRELHDIYRHDKRGGPVFDKVLGAAQLMKRRGVEFNILCTVNAANSQHPLEVYRFFRDEVEARYLQFIPIVERVNDTGYQSGNQITERSVEGKQYGRFLIEIFDEWVRRDIGTMFVQTFDGVLAAYVWGRSSLCVFRPSCGEGVALEHTGDVYSCDHFVEPDYLLGNILETPMQSLVDSPAQRAFGNDKSAGLPAYCQSCPWLFTCHGECPKNRVLLTPDGEGGLNWLCEGLRDFFEHTERPMRMMADLLQRGRPAADLMGFLQEEDRRFAERLASAGRNDMCPCGSGKKFKRCHGLEAGS